MLRTYFVRSRPRSAGRRAWLAGCPHWLAGWLTGYSVRQRWAQSRGAFNEDEKDLPSTDGAVRMRYQYKVTNAGQTLQFIAKSNFPGIPGLYTYAETYKGANPVGPPIEFPQF